jgi:hypothetical protein
MRRGRDEDLCLPHRAGDGISDRHSLSGKVHEQSFAGNMGLAHRWRDARAPIPIEVTEPAVAVSIRLPGPILFPQQQQGDAGAAQLGMQSRPVRLRSLALMHGERWREQLPLQHSVVQPVRHRPGDPDHSSPAQIFSQGANLEHRARRA